jgi:preprotein translocase subunit SecY
VTRSQQRGDNLIAVGAAIETMKQLRKQLVMRQYRVFIR